ncbi:LysR family transcriptional regulator [Paenibacillus sp. IB182496]|uniref:LysR family transcriptional regulator n=1 Tax=Paenibacillus sabuli TaxID=2772509 RepID=A0A927BV55_9BACL|nr:LysR family transcriptional regulator [Paenibacillus sabuli]MBD2846320.1 LysR family transcriptional regulator [Paenibacillus sabuli]
MQLEQLHYVIEVERTGSISAAAQRLHVSQSAVSKAISRLEKELGVTVFHRLPTGVVPTDSGRALIGKAREIAAKLQELERLADSHSRNERARLAIVCVPMYLPILSDALERLTTGHPRLQLELTEKSSAEIADDLLQERADLGFAILSEEIEAHPQLQTIALMQTAAWVCVGAESPLAQRPCLAPEELVEQQIVMYNGSLMHWLGQYLNRPLHYSVVTNNLESIRRKVAQGSAISILSALTVANRRFLEDGDIAAVPLHVEAVPYHLQIGLVKRRQGQLTGAAKALLRMLQQATPN